MMILGIVAASLFGLVALVGLIGLCLPRHWRVERSIEVDATPSSIFPLVNDFERGWSQWNSFVEPGMALGYDGPSSGVGSISTWKKGGQEGRMEMKESDPATGVVFRITMNNGCDMTGRIGFTRKGKKTIVSWVDDGEQGNPFFRVMVVAMKGYIGKKLEQSLAGIKKLAEKKPVAA